MDILWTLLTLPYAPMRGLTAVVKVIAREAESRQHNPVDVRRELEALDAAAAAGEISDAERDRGQQQVLERLTGGARRPAPAQGRTPARNGPGSRRENGGTRQQPGTERARQPGTGRARQGATERARQAGTERARRVPRGGGEGGERGGGSDPRRRRSGA
ncbi:gas vesicle protein GvpG [Micromonospora sp. M71_S20]|uniref:gas vesicle protein GvpG n=1 Tax=Micromonospora sp. M71_S20 TaxID=592872 RepID=UPI000EACDECA|nr:gas vesicle protein GvpG [Micromonospora sp. M71_S20]RLK08751.1 gas vesicle protein GvpG [Micromonospora sp. M71_S20]